MGHRRLWIAPAIAAAGACGVAAWLVSANPRLLVSWHGWLHVAIANQLPSATLVPENPFFAGEPLPYYWFYQLIGRLVAQAIGVSALQAFHFLALVSLAGLVAAAVAAGRSLFRSTAAGIAIAMLALAGLNPAGPVIAAAKLFASSATGMTDVDAIDQAVTGGDVFVTNEDADVLMARPLLGAMYFGTDWRSGQNIVWFFDISSRGPALALVLCVAWLFVDPRRSHGRLIALALAAAGVAALNPVMGIALAAVLMAVAMLMRLQTEARLRALVVVAGAAVAAPTYSHLFGAGGAASATPYWIGVKLIAALASFIVIVPLAFNRDLSAVGDSAGRLRALAWTGLALVMTAVVVALPEANEHNLANAAACVLAVPAAGWVVRVAASSAQRRRALLLAAVFAPVTACTLYAFGGREPLPLRIDGGALHRVPVDGAIDAFYAWARSTPENAVFVTDPDRPLKMSGNVTEIPAFTGRGVFVDHASYLTQPHADRERRANIARRLLAGEALAALDETYLNEMRRPIFLVSVAPDDPARSTALATRYGPAAFTRDFVAVYALTPAR